MSNRPSWNVESGLTLLELLVALGLAAFVGVAVYAMHNAVMGAYDHARQWRRQEHAHRMFTEVLNDDLRSIYTQDSSDTNFYFIGRQARSTGDEFLEFTTTASLDLLANPESTELKRVRYVLERGSVRGTFDIVREEWPHCGLDADYDWTSVTVMTDVTSVSMGFFDDLSNEFSDQWISDPNVTDRFMRPTAVRVALSTSADHPVEDILVKLPAARYLVVQ